jgi:hypothetical protein
VGEEWQRVQVGTYTATTRSYKENKEDGKGSRESARSPSRHAAPADASFRIFGSRVNVIDMLLRGPHFNTFETLGTFAVTMRARFCY